MACGFAAVTIGSTAPALLALVALLAAPAAGDDGFSYEDWNTVLETHADARGLVDYDALARAPQALDRFLASVARTSPVSHPALFPTRDTRLAYYLNAYNAWVFRGVLARGPERDSVWEGGLISGRSFFVGMDIVLGGERTSLKSLEDRTIRQGFRDPRVHAALNCASLGCPRLGRRAFDPSALDAELDAAMTEFVGEERNVALDDATHTVTLSKIFDWFEGDFLSYEREHGNTAPRIADYVNRYRGALRKVPSGWAVRFRPYDKSINRR